MPALTRLALFVLVCLALAPAIAHAQASITGVVRDTSGAVLPGVTVEAASPVLIEKVRTVVTDGSGQYRIVDLRPGAYTVTFTLAGFSVVRREGIELVGTFTATVNTDLRVGALEETITVTGESPIVDVQRVTQQRVFTQEVIEAEPYQHGGARPGTDRRPAGSRHTCRCRGHEQSSEYDLRDPWRPDQRHAAAT